MLMLMVDQFLSITIHDNFYLNIYHTAKGMQDLIKKISYTIFNFFHYYK